MTDAPPETPPTADPPKSDADQEELARLRQEAADRKKADDDARETELAELRAYREENEKKKKVEPPPKKADPPAPTPTPTPPEPPPAAKKQRGWFPDDD